MVSNEGYSAQVSNNPEDLNFNALSGFDILILDILMPHLDGFSILEIVPEMSKKNGNSTNFRFRNK